MDSALRVRDRFYLIRFVYIWRPGDPAKNEIERKTKTTIIPPRCWIQLRLMDRDRSWDGWV